MKFSLIIIGLLTTFGNSKKIYDDQIVLLTKTENEEFNVNNITIDNHYSPSHKTNNKLPSCKNISNYKRYQKDYDCSEYDVFCFDENENTVYGLSNLMKCKNNALGIHLFEILNQTKNREVDIYNGAVNYPENLCLYQCDETECKQTYGHIKVNTLNKKYDLVSSHYYYISENGSGIDMPVEIESSEECKLHIGELVKNKSNDNDYEVCLYDYYSIPYDTDINSYELLSGLAGSKNPYTQDLKTDSNIVIAINSNIFIQEKLFSYFQYGYHIIWYNGYLECSETGCKIKTEFLNTCDDEDSDGKLAIIGKPGDENIYICSHNEDDNKIIILDQDFDSDIEDKESFFTKYNNSDINKLQKRSRNIVNEPSNNNIYIIESGFPGAGNRGKAAVRVADNNIYCLSGKFGNMKKDVSGERYLSSTISYCEINDDNKYMCNDEKALLDEYYMLDNYGDTKLFHLKTRDHMEEIILEDGYYINRREYIVAKNGYCYAINAEDFDDDERCINHSGYIFYNPTPLICLNFTNGLTINNDNKGSYLIMFTYLNPFEFKKDFFRAVKVSNNKITFINTNDEEITYCINDNWELTIKEDVCSRSEVTCKNSICTIPK